MQNQHSEPRRRPVKGPSKRPRKGAGKGAGKGAEEGLNHQLVELASRVGEVLLERDRGIGYLEATAKVGMVRAAVRVFSRGERRMTNSTIAVATGIPRHEVARILRSPEAFIEKFWRANRAVRVASQWRLDPHFNPNQTDPPPPLPLTGDGSFTSLVRKHSGDIPVVCMRDYMLDAGTLKEEGKGDAMRLVLLPKPADPEDDHELRAKLTAVIEEFDL